MRPWLPATLAIALVACDEEKGPTLGEVHPLPTDLREIDLSYLPYEHLDDGCQYRAPYLAMELAVHGIPSFAVMAESCTRDLEMEGPEGVTWRFHSSIAVGTTDAPRIIEPVLADDYLTLDAWRASFGVDTLNVFYLPAAYPEFGAETAACGAVEAREPSPATVAEMTPFHGENVLIWCAYMRADLRRVTDDWEARDAHLVRRTHELFQTLDALGLIDDFGGSVRAKLADGPWCPEPNFGP